MNKINPYLFFAWIVSITAMLGSLYFSEIRQFVPCTLCWYQRILMYPLTVSLGIAVFKNDRSITTYVLPISILGMITALYHYGIQKVPFMRIWETCKVGVPCSAEYINVLGFITIPFLSLTAFTLITISFFVARKRP